MTVLAFAVAAGVAAGGAAVGGPAQAGTTGRPASPADIPGPIPLPLVGLTRDQSVRLSAVNLGSAQATLTATLRGTGGVLASTSLVVAPQHIGYFTLNGASRALTFDSRGRLQVWGQLSGPAGTSVAGSLEVFDNSNGTTQVLVRTPATATPVAQRTLVSGPMGVRAGQIARVSVVNLDTAAVTVSAGILQTNSVLTRVITLQPGEIRSVDVDPVGRGLTFDRSGRAQVRARVGCRSAVNCLVASTLEVFAVTNGHSSEGDPLVTPIQLP